MEELPNVPGVPEVIAWFGRWPSFHDAEVTRVHLNRSGPSYIDLHTFRMTSQITPSGHYLCDRHAVVTFELVEIVDSHLGDFGHQNVISGLDLTGDEEGFEMKLYPCYGLTGSVKAKAIKLTLAPGIPKDSTYSAQEFDSPALKES